MACTKSIVGLYVALLGYTAESSTGTVLYLDKLQLHEQHTGLDRLGPPFRVPSVFKMQYSSAIVAGICLTEVGNSSYDIAVAG